MTHNLEPVVFWQLRALCTDTQRLAVQAQSIGEALQTARKKQDKLVTELAQELKFDPKVQMFTLDDETLTLNIPEGQPVA
jgi:hypothetical protein